MRTVSSQPVASTSATPFSDAADLPGLVPSSATSRITVRANNDDGAWGSNSSLSSLLPSAKKRAYGDR